MVAKLEIEENADLPDAISLQLPVAAEDGELTWVGDGRIAPYANIAVVVTPDDGDPAVHLRRLRADPQGAHARRAGRRDRRRVGAGRHAC